jgi:multimeric flavodoxin WrbA
MNAVVLNGVGQQDVGAEVAGQLAAWLAGRGAPAAVFDLTSMEIKPCRGCFECWTTTPGECHQHDAMETVLRRLAHADLIVWITPVAFGGYGYHLKKALDRSIPILLPFFKRYDGEIHHPLRYNTVPRLAAVGILPRPDPDTESIFHRLVGRNARNMHAQSLSLVLHQDEWRDDWAERLAPLVEEGAH